MKKDKNVMSARPALSKAVWIPLAAIGLCLLLAMPRLVNSYVLRILIMIALYGVLSISLNYIVGDLGQISLGHAAFYAIGAFTSVYLTKKCGVNYFPSALAGAVVAALAGVLLALLTMRMAGIYLAVTTMGFLEVVRTVILNWRPVTGGSQGMSSIPKPELFGFKFTLTNGGFYYLILVYLLICVVVTHLVDRSRWGRAFRAIREDPLAAQFTAIDLYGYKIRCFAISAFFAGLAGSFYAHFLGYINNNTFTYSTSVTILCMVILGGRGTIRGALIGAVILAPMSELLRSLTEAMSNLPSWLISDPERWRFVIYGLILVLMMRFRPQGLLGGRSRAPYKLPRGIRREEKV